MPIISCIGIHTELIIRAKVTSYSGYAQLFSFITEEISNFYCILHTQYSDIVESERIAEIRYLDLCPYGNRQENARDTGWLVSVPVVWIHDFSAFSVPLDRLDPEESWKIMLHMLHTRRQELLQAGIHDRSKRHARIPVFEAA